MTLKKRIVAVVVGIALIVAVTGTSARVANSLVSLDASVGQAIACNTGSASGGGC